MVPFPSLPASPSRSHCGAKATVFGRALIVMAALFASPAAAYDIEVASETIGQGYQILGGNGDVISRRRLDQYLGLSVWNLGPKDAAGQPLLKNQWYFTSSF